MRRYEQLTGPGTGKAFHSIEAKEKNGKHIHLTLQTWKKPATKGVSMGSFWVQSQFGTMKKIQMDGSDGCTTMRRYLKPMNWTLQNV